MSLELRVVAGPRDRRRFRDLPRALHRAQPAFVPPLDAQFASYFSPRNPFWKRARSREWLALRDGRAVARIGACTDEDLAGAADGAGAVGFFECAADEPGAAEALFETALDWLRSQGRRRVRGPLNYTIHDTAGLLVEGFDTPPAVDTTWNPPWYEGFWRAAGFAPAQDLLGVAGDVVRETPERARRLAERALGRGLRVRPLDFARFDEEVETVRGVYNRAWEANWGHVPIDRETFAYKARDLKPAIDPDIVRIGEVEGQAVAFLLALPDYNVAIRRSGGRLLPLGWWRMLRQRRAGGRARVVALGVVPGFRIRGVEAALLHRAFEASGGRYTWCEASWVLDHNKALLNGLALYGLRPYKRWRLFERSL